MNILFKDGQTVKYDLNKIESIEFTDDKSESSDEGYSLVGTWDYVSNKFYSDFGDVETEEEDGGYWVFTETKVTCYDPEDLLNGVSSRYTFDGKVLQVGDYLKWDVLVFTREKLVLKIRIVNGYQELTLKKRT